MSLRTRLILTFVSIILVTLTIVAISLAVILRTYQRDIQLARLGDAVIPIAVQARAMLATDTAPKEIVTRLKPQTDGIGDIIIIDGKGLVLADATFGLTNRNIGVAQFKRPNGNPNFVWGTFQQRALSRVLVYVAVASGQFNGQPVYVGLVAREQPFFAVLDEIGVSLGLAGAATLIVSLLLAFILARSIAQPITKLTQATEAIAKGQYAHRVDAKGGDEIGRLATSFNAMAEQVQRARQMEKDFVADVSHELKTPLTSIQGFAQAILDGAIDDLNGARRAAQTIFDETARMTGLVGDLLTLARLESGQLPLARDTIDLAQVLPAWIERCQPRAAQLGMTLTTSMDALPPITGDANRLQQVVTNLVENALKYNQPGGNVAVYACADANGEDNKNVLTARRKASVPQFVRIEVRDNGAGIPPEDLPRVFERFYRGDKARVAGGTGLGLSIAQEIVHAHGGTIVVASEAGKGSTFTVRLPVENT